MTKQAMVPAAQMSKREFAGLLVKITNTGRTLDRLIARGIAYCAAQHINHHNKNEWQRLRDAAPVFARRIIDDARKACNGADSADEEALHEVEASADQALEERRTKIAQKKPKVEESQAPEVPKVPQGERWSLIHVAGEGNGKDDVMPLDAEEYQIALAAIQAHREEARKLKKVS